MKLNIVLILSWERSSKYITHNEASSIFFWHMFTFIEDAYSAVAASLGIEPRQDLLHGFRFRAEYILLAEAFPTSAPVHDLYDFSLERA